MSFVPQLKEHTTDEDVLGGISDKMPTDKMPAKIA